MNIDFFSYFRISLNIVIVGVGIYIVYLLDYKSFAKIYWESERIVRPFFS